MLTVIDLHGKRLRSIAPLPYSVSDYRTYSEGNAQRTPEERTHYCQFRRVFWPRPELIVAEYKEYDEPHSNIMSCDRRRNRRIGDRGRISDDCEVSSDGQQIVYVEGEHACEETVFEKIVLENLRTHRRRQLYFRRHGPVAGPSASPDTSRICFVRGRDHHRNQSKGVDGLWIVDLKQAMRRLVRMPFHVNSNPKWSPDGRWIAFARHDERSGLYLYDLSKRTTRFIGKRLGIHGLTWTPDSRSLISAEGADGVWCIAVPSGRTKMLAPDGYFPCVRKGRRHNTIR